jgi:hypothetical protein
MTARRDAGVVLAMCAWARKQLAKVEEHAKTVADVTFPDEKMAAVVDDTVVAYTSRQSRRHAEPLNITDEQGFVKWVAERWPTEIEETVRKSFINLVLVPGASQPGRDGYVFDDEGEACPYARLKDPITYTRTLLTKDADRVLEPLLSMLLLADLPDYIEGAS